MTGRDGAPRPELLARGLSAPGAAPDTLAPMATTAQSVADICAQAQRAARELATLDTATKDAALEAMATALEQRSDEILEANARDMEAGEEAGLHAGLLDRLKLTEERLAGIARDVRSIVALPDPVGETIDGHKLENGLDVRRVRVPLGVVAVVYEARPNVTIDCSALCLKSGNAIVLRGSSTAAHSNAVLAEVAVERRRSCRRPRGRDLDRQRRRPRRAAPDRDAGRRRRPDHPARRRGPEGGAQGARHGARHVRGCGQLPRVRRRGGRPRQGGGDRRQREDPAPVGLQRGRDAPRPRRHRGRVPAARAPRAARVGRRAARRRAHARARGRPRPTRSPRPPRRTGRPSTTR